MPNLKDLSEWKLNASVFKTIFHARGPPDTELSASWICYQLPLYMSWKIDPFSWRRDAFQMNWSQIFTYTFHPFTVIEGFWRRYNRSRFNNNYISMADTNIASRVTQNLCQEPTPSRKSGPSSGPSRKWPSSDPTKLSKTMSLDRLKENLQAEGISKRATTLIKDFWKTI